MFIFTVLLHLVRFILISSVCSIVTSTTPHNNSMISLSELSDHGNLYTIDFLESISISRSRHPK